MYKEKMTEEKFKKEYNKIIEWGIKETDKVTKILKKEGKLQGLDTNTEEYEPIHAEIKLKIKTLKEQYALTK